MRSKILGIVLLLFSCVVLQAMDGAGASASSNWGILAETCVDIITG